ncbi:MAG: DUF5791 family protein [Halodesulfurarchaeum sp.]
MLMADIDDPDTLSASELHRRMVNTLSRTVRDVGVAEAARETDIAEARLEDLSGADPPLSLSEAGAILALSSDLPDGDIAARDLRDRLLLAMSAAIVDVDTLAAGLDGELSARDIQQKIEGRRPMTLKEFAEIYQFVEARRPD